MTTTPELLKAYQNTDYLVRTNGGDNLIKVDQPSAFIASIHRSHHTDRSAVITAYNPASEPHDEAYNAEATTNLLAYIKGVWPRTEVRYVDPTGKWADEHGFFIMRIGYEDTCALANGFRQNAFLYTYMDNTPRLAYRTETADTFPFGYTSAHDDTLVPKQHVSLNLSLPEPSSIDGILAFMDRKGYVCPLPIPWRKMYAMLKHNERDEPLPPPLSKPALNPIDLAMMRQRFTEQLAWAERHRKLSFVDYFVRIILPEDWVKDM